MLGIILIYFIGKKFYELAKQFNQNNWLYAILGIASYYFGSIVIGGVIIGLIIELFMSTSIDGYSDLGVGIMVLPFGLATTYLFHFLLKKKWEKTVMIVKDEIQDIGKSIED